MEKKIKFTNHVLIINTVWVQKKKKKILLDRVCECKVKSVRESNFFINIFIVYINIYSFIIIIIFYLGGNICANNDIYISRNKKKK